MTKEEIIGQLQAGAISAEQMIAIKAAFAEISEDEIRANTQEMPLPPVPKKFTEMDEAEKLERLATVVRSLHQQFEDLSSRLWGDEPNGDAAWT